MNAPLLGTRALQVRAGQRVLVDGLDWQVRTGERWSLLGPNGCGKTTLLRTLAGLRPPAGGEVELGGRPLARIRTRELATLRAWCPQHHHDAFGLSVLEVVLAARQPYAGRMGWLGPDDERLALEALQRCDVAHLAAQDVRSLSGGERQRVALAAMLAQATPLVLLDEPTAHLDVPHQLAACALLAQLHDQAVVMSLHDVNLALRCCTHALLWLPDGNGAPRWMAGPLDQVLHPDHLARAYGSRMLAVTLEGHRYYVPAPR
ncbi:ABC transporter ATP-binding protein [Caldimonas thermodepolymerans]|uniref:ABC transporter ATP-binding protein n=1 Tax=Caldimonas thermodepolymerans TaxID=215580 RepID=UPI002235984C|nr:ABC transporter ATP-binding protein [Caldimonas thermodepolymerans]UZG42806.1 ABC transporter ATP-binding protein [Caldimonas thermodepolymerans]